MSPKSMGGISGSSREIFSRSTMPERSRELLSKLKASDRSNSKALVSKVKAFSKACWSTVKSELISNRFSLLSSPKELPVSTFTWGFSSCCCTMELAAACSITCWVKEAG